MLSPMAVDSKRSFYEFFAGGGMARLGLGPAWRCAFANDLDPMKTAVYRANFSSHDLREADVWDVRPKDLPGRADLAWASFPCQDLSLAGKRAGLEGDRSGTFFGFWRLMEALRREKRPPRLLVLENVSGALTSRGGKDFVALARLLADAGWRFGALELDAARFLPQSRPRLFIIAQRADAPLDAPFAEPYDDALAIPPFGFTPALLTAAQALPPDLAAHWVWWRLPQPPPRQITLADIVETDAEDARWHTPEETERLIGQMAARHLERVWEAQSIGGVQVGAAYRRTRAVNGARVVRAEVRFDGLAGCLRTPAGGSSRQFLLFCDGERVRSRPVRPREAARLMGLPDGYVLPERTTAALHVLGDGLAAPVVRWLAKHLLEPLSAREPGPIATTRHTAPALTPGLN